MTSTPHDSESDVLVIGGGPAGSTMASFLTKKLERSSGLRARPRSRGVAAKEVRVPREKSSRRGAR